jgi:hypothetical protein
MLCFVYAAESRSLVLRRLLLLLSIASWVWPALVLCLSRRLSPWWPLRHDVCFGWPVGLLELVLLVLLLAFRRLTEAVVIRLL